MKKLTRFALILIVILLIAFTVFWFARDSDVNFDESRSSLPNAAYSHFAEIDGVRIHYQEKGEGAPLVLIHGYTASTFAWKDVFEPLSRQFRVIAVDLKGFGFSGKPEGDYTRRAQGELMIRFLDHLKIDRAILCGNSMGGEVSLNAAVRHPDRVSALILVDSAGVTVSGGGSVTPGVAEWPVIGPAVAALALTSDSLVRDGLRQSFYDDSIVTEEQVTAYHRPLKTRGGQRAAYLARIQDGVDPIEPEINKIRLPTLIIWGAEDELMPLEAGRRLNSLIAGSRLVVFDKCGHVPQAEMPERFVGEVRGFVTSLNQTSNRSANN
ncbi:MAG TPA: alpha/beta hydrolase [Blastocatellia bacterium]|nr:alpha/beta hydrolase [Blastocatellia bacterium]